MALQIAKVHQIHSSVKYTEFIVADIRANQIGKQVGNHVKQNTRVS